MIRSSSVVGVGSEDLGVPASPSGSQASPGAADASPPSVSIPDAVCAEDGRDHFLCGCITGHVRDVMQRWTGTNCTWADDDVTVLGALAGEAIALGRHRALDLPPSLLAAIDTHRASAIEAATAGETEGLDPKGESAVDEVETPTPSHPHGDS